MPFIMRHGRLRAWLVLALAALAASCGPAPAPATAGGASEPAAPGAGASAQAGPSRPVTREAPPPPSPSREELLRRELALWKDTPYSDKGRSRRGVGNAAFVSIVLASALDVDVPASHDQLIRMGKLVERPALQAGDLVFFEGDGVGPFRGRSVGLYVGDGEVAIAHKDLGVRVGPIDRLPWKQRFRTGRRLPAEAAEPPAFDASSYGSNRGALLRDIARAWAGTLYKQGGTTFDGIGNDEFVREVYGAVFEDELEGTPKAWEKLGRPVKQADLEPGDIILYEAVGIGSIVNQKHAGLYIGGGEFVHSVKGAAVTISRLTEPRWRSAYKMARRIDPDPAGAEPTPVAAAARAASAPRPAVASGGATSGASGTAASPAAAGSAREVTEVESRLRRAYEPWAGTPYKIGGTSKRGVDCSAFVRAVYQDVYDVELPRTAQEQERLGTTVKKNDLEAGDLVFFRTQGMGPLFRSRHVGVYLGGGEFAHASGKRGVTIARLDNRYWSRKYATARRVGAASDLP
jgi:cell wall-associated NlpC family hydrolase